MQPQVLEFRVIKADLKMKCIPNWHHKSDLNSAVFSCADAFLITVLSIARINYRTASYLCVTGVPVVDFLIECHMAFSDCDMGTIHALRKIV